MGMRKYRRSIAKARMKEMGLEHVNKNMGLGISRAKLREAFRCMGKKSREELRKHMQEAPIWRRILTGDLAKQYWAAKRRLKMTGFHHLNRKRNKVCLKILYYRVIS